MLNLLNFLAPVPETLSFSIKKYGTADSQDPAFSYIDWKNHLLYTVQYGTLQYVFFGSSKKIYYCFTVCIAWKEQRFIFCLFHNCSGLFTDSELDFLLIRTVSIRIVAIPTVLACLLRYNITYVDEKFLISVIATNS